MKVVVSAPAWRAPWTAPATPASDWSWTTRGTTPQMFCCPCADHSSASSAIVEEGVMG